MKFNTIFALVISEKGVKFLTEFSVNLLILKQFGIVDYGIFATALAYSTLIASLVFMGGREVQLKYLQAAKTTKNREEVFFKIFSFRIIAYMFFMLLAFTYFYFNDSNFNNYFLPLSFNSLLILNLLIENYSTTIKKHEEFKKISIKLSIFLLLFQISILVLNIFSFQEYLWIYAFKFLISFSFLYKKNINLRFSFINPKYFIKILLENKLIIYVQILIVIFQRLGIFATRYFVDEKTAGSISLSFTIFFIFCQIFLSFMISYEEQYYAKNNLYFSNKDKEFTNNIYIVTIFSSLCGLIIFNLLYFIPVVKQFVYLRISFSLLIFSLPLIIYLSVQKFVLIKLQNKNLVKRTFYNLLITCLVYILFINVLSTNLDKYFIELSYLLSLTLFLFLNIDFKNIKIKYLQLDKSILSNFYKSLKELLFIET